MSPMTIQQLLDTTRSYLAGRDDRLVNDFVATLDWAREPRRLDPRPLPCLSHLGDVLAHAGEKERPLVRLIVENAQSLAWGQTYRADDFGEAFLRNYGWMELFGTRGHFVNDRFAGGFLLLGPHIDYPDHHHIAEEIYIPLTGGAEWRAGDTGFRKWAAGEVIHHPSNMVHAMRTGDAPLLAFYLWRGGPLDQRSTIGGQTEKA
ncbi:MAG TPA: dimethylsulfonioproprionate lyase family protein [Rhizobiaceae bacterium]|nr:dimethylsulfonioproprionate lyase family protein [Rhizobiaceae bacterium]